MSVIYRLYDSTAVTYRQTLVSGSTVKKEYTSYLATFNCNVQPLEATLGEGLVGAFGKEWVMFCDVLDFKEGDKVVVNLTDEYRVSGVEKMQMGGNKHAEVSLRAFKE